MISEEPIAIMGTDREGRLR